MKQITQNLNTGNADVVEVPLSACKKGCLLVQTAASLVSAGTERMLMDFGRSNYLQKAKQQPDKVKEVLQKVKTDGLLSTYEAVKSKLDQPMPMGYCNVGQVVAIGEGVDGFELGDWVASNGNHAEYVCVPKNLCAKVPAGVTPEAASFTVLASIALQSVRLVKPELGETVVVSGLGLVGLLTVQLLRSHGCQVIGTDYNKARLRLAEKFGATTIDLNESDDPVSLVQEQTAQMGSDAVIIAAATSSNEPISQAAQMCRKRGRVVLVGVAGLNLSRADFFKKEISFQVSCSYGAGRYDTNYEEKGQDYPVGYVRWTEQRNFQAVLQSLKEGWLSVSDLITHRFKLEEAEQAYQTLLEDKASLGIVLSYPKKEYTPEQLQAKRTLRYEIKPQPEENVSVSVIGAGNYASRMLIPAFVNANVALNTLYANSGLSCQTVGKKQGFKQVSTDVDSLWSSQTNLVVIATRHNSHSSYVCESLRAAKHVFVEKPLALTLEKIDQIESLYHEQEAKTKVMVGFNRRFSPYIQKMKRLLISAAQPMAITMTINAGAIPADHWTQDKQVGGGRIIGEACHFIDLARFLSGSKIIASTVQYMKDSAGCADTAVISLSFSDGSVASINYFANGNKAVAKERIDVFCGGKSLCLNNFRHLTGRGWKGFKKMSSMKQNKGQFECAQAFVDAVREGKESPIPFNEILEVSRVVITLAK